MPTTARCSTTWRTPGSAHPADRRLGRRALSRARPRDSRRRPRDRAAQPQAPTRVRALAGGVPAGPARQPRRPGGRRRRRGGRLSAPEWSLDHRAPWAFAILAEEGIRLDASRAPVARVGSPSFPRRPHPIATAAGALLELPPLVGRLAGQAVPLGWGWGLRKAEPAAVVEAIAANNRQGDPAVLTVHPWEIDPAPPHVRLPPRSPSPTTTGCRASGRACARCWPARSSVRCASFRTPRRGCAPDRRRAAPRRADRLVGVSAAGCRALRCLASSSRSRARPRHPLPNLPAAVRVVLTASDPGDVAGRVAALGTWPIWLTIAASMRRQSMRRRGRHASGPSSRPFPHWRPSNSWPTGPIRDARRS